MKIGTLNIHSVNNKIDDVHEVMLNHHLSALVLTETWHEDSECVTVKKIRSLGYNLIEAARPIKPATKQTRQYSFRQPWWRRHSLEAWRKDHQAQRQIKG